MNTGQVPGHLIAAARTGFLQSVRKPDVLWRRVASEIALGGASETLVDLGAAPMPKRSTTGVTVQEMVERIQTLKPFDWDITVHITSNAIRDDRTGELEVKVRSAGTQFNRHLDKLVFDAMNTGASITSDYGASYDKLSMFNANHVDNGAAFQTVQSNVNTLALDATNFQTVYVAAATRIDDQGEQTGYMPDLLIVPPALANTAIQFTENRAQFGSVDTVNPYYGRLQHIIVPYLDSTAWMLAATSEAHKPILVGMRERPSLQAAWFDPEKPDGGWYLFKFFARYSVGFGDWRLLTQGNT